MVYLYNRTPLPDALPHMGVRAGTFLQRFCGMGDNQLIVALASRTCILRKRLRVERLLGVSSGRKLPSSGSFNALKSLAQARCEGCMHIESEQRPYAEAISERPCGSSVSMALMRPALFGVGPGGKMHCRLIFKKNGCHFVLFLQIRLRIVAPSSTHQCTFCADVD